MNTDNKTPNIVQVIRSAVDRLPDSEAAQLDEAYKTVYALVEALKEFVPGSSSMTLTEVERIDRAIAALRTAGVATEGGLEESL